MTARRVDPLADRLRRWMLDQLSDAEAEVVEVEFLQSAAGNALHHQVETELIAAYLDGELSVGESSGFSRLMLSCPRLASTVGETIRSRLLAGEPIEATNREVALRISAEAGRLCLNYRDRTLSPEDEERFTTWVLGDPWLPHLVDWAFDLLRLPNPVAIDLTEPSSLAPAESSALPDAKRQTRDLSLEVAPCFPAGGSHPRPAFSSNGHRGGSEVLPLRKDGSS